MDLYSLPDHIDADAIDAVDYRELLRRDSMSVGIYQLPPGSDDPQSPHGEDEIYHVLAGRAKVRVGEEVNPVRPGDVVFVEREVDHEFLDIEEALALLVVFAPAEGTCSD